MKLTKKVRYGFRTMIEIALNEGILQKEISIKQQIPLKFLDAVITGLRTKGLIRSTKGKKSGYMLALDANLITLYDIYCAFEPPVNIIDCSFPGYCCNLQSSCLINCFLVKINKQIIESFKQYTLHDIITKNLETELQL